MWRIDVLTDALLRDAAECHIECWREAYRGIVPDHVLDAFDVDRRADSWRRQQRAAPNPTYLCLEDDGERTRVVGFANAGPARHGEQSAELELHSLYVRRSHYGTGAGAALMTHAIGESAWFLWVFERNLRARAFYRRHGFADDGVSRVDAITIATQIRMTRSGPAAPTDSVHQ